MFSGWFAWLHNDTCFLGVLCGYITIHVFCAGCVVVYIAPAWGDRAAGDDGGDDALAPLCDMYTVIKGK